MDGQQRLTTLTVLLAAIRDHRVATESPEHRERINEQYLINKFKPESSADQAGSDAGRPAAVQGVSSTGHRHGRQRRCSTPTASSGAGSSLPDDPEDPHDIERLEDAVFAGSLWSP